jgi:hypothetical protein
LQTMSLCLGRDLRSLPLTYKYVLDQVIFHKAFNFTGGMVLKFDIGDTFDLILRS